MFVSFPYEYIYWNPDKYLGFSRQICFSFLVRSRGAPQFMYPLGIQWMQHPWLTWVVGGFSLVHSFIRLLDPPTAVEPLTFIYYIIWFRLFLNSPLELIFLQEFRNSIPDSDPPKCQPCWRYVLHILFFFWFKFTYTHGSPALQKKAFRYIYQ